MRFKAKGRKIYQQKPRFEKIRAFWSNTGAVLLTILLVGVLGFVGFSAGKPILNFLEEQHILAKPAPSETAAAPTEVSTEAAPGAFPETAATDTSSEPVTEPVTDPVPKNLEIRGVKLPVQALISEETLTAALGQIPDKVDYVFLPLKVTGGQIYYATTIQDVSRNGAVQAFMKLDQIYTIIVQKGFHPVAVINALEDNYYPKSFPESAYHTKTEGKPWQDPAGKAWLSPFSDLARQYLAEVTAEVYTAGFEEIVCEGLTFPKFPEEIRSQLPPEYLAEDRYSALVQTVETMKEAAPGAILYLGASGDSILNNETEVLAAAEALKAEGMILSVSQTNAPNAQLLRDSAGSVPVVLAWDKVPETEEYYVQIMSAGEKPPAESKE